MSNLMKKNNNNENCPGLNKSVYSRLSKQASSFDSRRKSILFRKRTTISNSKGETRSYKVQFGEANSRLIDNKLFGNNEIKTTKYNVFTFIPKNLLFQFTRASNIYFLIVTILTFMSFSPKDPASMIGTFVFVLFCTLVKDGVEDLGRYNQDRLSNNRLVLRFNKGEWIKEKCFLLRPGDLIKIEKEEEFSCDVLIIKTSNAGGYLFLDTKNLDGETNLKEKGSLETIKDLPMENKDLQQLKGEIETTNSDANLNEWEGVMTYNDNVDIYCSMKNLVLKGSVLKNTGHVYGIVVYAGHNTKIMKNAKEPKPKTSKIIQTMNKLLYTLFVFTIAICIIFGVFNVKFTDANGTKYTYIFHSYNPEDTSNHWGVRFGLNFLIFFITYSQIIPISLYVAMEIIKLFEGKLIKYDNDIYYRELHKPAVCRASELIEELGQVDFIFTDKTGTLTQNVMIFKKCFVNGKVYGVDLDSNSIYTAVNTINGDYSAYEKLVQTDTDNPNDKKDKEMLDLFFTLLTVCHEVFPEIKDNAIIYQGNSPDDIALVKGAQQLGYEFQSKDFNTLSVTSLLCKDNVQFQVEVVIPFSSDRKRMSVIVKELRSGKFFIFSKGSDAIMVNGFPFHDAIITQYGYNKEKKETKAVLDLFSKEGLRILVMGYKEIPSDYFESWLKRHEQAQLKSQELLDLLYDEIERDLTFVGCSAIEDKLQEGVPETIRVLLSCGIRIWVLTGDKQDTAEQIGRQCFLITNDMHLINLTVENGTKEEIRKILLQLIDRYELEDFLEEKKINLEKITEVIEYTKESKYLSVIVDGICLEQILLDESLAKMFFVIASLAKSVIFSRVSPKQKSQVVRLTKENGDFVTLSIGDGANDVPMILEASIGIGIQGKEGTQAVRSADYSIGQFRFLEKLLLYYGRNGYIKISKYICYYFYKNILLVVTELCFAFYNGFSGQIFFADWLGTMFNAIFTSWPCLFTFAFEKQHSIEICKQYPILYNAGPKNVYFNLKIFWVYILYGLIHSVLCFYIPVGSLKDIADAQGKTMNHWKISTLSFSCVIHVVSIKLMLISDFWNVFSITFSVVSVLFYYLIVVLLCTEFFGKIFQNELIGVSLIFTDFKSLLILIFGPFIIVLPDIIMKQLGYVFFPSPTEYLHKYRFTEDFKRSMIRTGTGKRSTCNSNQNKKEKKKKEKKVESSDSLSKSNGNNSSNSNGTQSLNQSAIDHTITPLRDSSYCAKPTVMEMLNHSNVETKEMKQKLSLKTNSLTPNALINYSQKYYMHYKKEENGEGEAEMNYDNLNKPDESNSNSKSKSSKLLSGDIEVIKSITSTKRCFKHEKASSNGNKEKVVQVIENNDEMS